MVTDPVLLEIVKNAMGTAAEEMGLAVVRSGYSTIIKESGDASSAIFDREGRVVAQSQGTPLMHLSSLRPTLRSMIEDFPLDTMQDGDIYVSNDPYRGGIHSNDVVVCKPVFHKDRIVAFTGALIHVADIGGVSAGGLPATATEMFHEGLMLPPMKLFEAGKPNDSLMRIIPANSRTPEKVMGDLRALIAACNVGAARILTLGEKYGHDELHSITDELMAYSETRTRQEIAKIPAGTYEGSFLIDDDGVTDKPEGYTVRVKMRVEGSSFQADFTGTSPQARGPINAATSQVTSGILFAVRSQIDPTIPMNEGCYRPLDIILPPGTLVNPLPPAPFNARMATVMASIEAMLRGLSQAYPERAVAASSNVHVYTMNGIEPSGRVWIYMDANQGGTGARSTKDGLDVEGALIFGGGGGGTSVEAYEQEYPVLFQRHQLWQDSGGAGKFRGGLGLRREVKILDSGQVTARATDRCRFPPPGLFDGATGHGGGWVINMDQQDEKVLAPKVSGVPLKAGDTLTMLTSGGGGFGPSWQRDLDAVLRDVEDGIVSIESARRDYGVVIDQATLAIDHDETKRIRATLASGS